jgi:hypothetical protein
MPQKSTLGAWTSKKIGPVNLDRVGHGSRLKICAFQNHRVALQY